MMVSIYKNIEEVTGGKDAPITLVLDAIKAGRWRKRTEDVRAIEDEKERNKAKIKMPNFTVSGTFHHRHDPDKNDKYNVPGLIQHSGIIACDVDTGKGKNENIDLNALREDLKQDTFVYSFFTSVGGAGLAVLFKIPPENHRAAFRALQIYFKEQYGVKIDSLPNVDRVRFVSYDPELYLNSEAATWEEVLTEEEYQAITRNYPKDNEVLKPKFKPLASTTSTQMILDRVSKNILQAPDGEKHIILNKMGFLLGGYVATGFIPENEAVHTLTQALAQRGNVADWKGAERTIRVSVRDGQRKPILPDEVELYVRTQKREMEFSDTVVQKLSASHGIAAHQLKPAVEEIYKEKQTRIEKFWRLFVKDEKKGTTTLELSKSKYLAFLEDAGFGTYKEGKNHLIVQVKDNIVRKVDRKEIKQYVLAYINSLPFEFDGIFRFELDERLKSEHRIWFEEGLLEMLPGIGTEFQTDTREKAFFYFNNGFVEVTKSGMELKPYSVLSKRIWLEQVINRDFTPLDQGAEGDYYQFLFNISGQDENRLLALMSAMGYLLHGYKAPSNPKVIILVDEQISDVPSGGTGKGLVFQAIKRMQQTEILDGKTFDFKDKFTLQNVSETTRLIVFEDWDGKRLPFDKLFNMTTNELKVNRLYLGQVSIPYERSPKFAITSNDMVSGEGDSHARRKFELEIAPHYSASFTPVDEFGKEFFNGWEPEEWNKFDNLMLSCTSIFLAKGLQNTAPININRRKLLQETSESFVEFCDGIARGYQFYKKDLWVKFLLESGNDDKRFSFDRFKRYLTKYFKYEGLEVEQGKNQTAGELYNQTYFTILESTNPRLP